MQNICSKGIDDIQIHNIFAICSIPKHPGHWWYVFVQRSYEEDKYVSEGSEEDDDYVPYVPVKIRKQQMVGCAIIVSLSVLLSYLLFPNYS